MTPRIARFLSFSLFILIPVTVQAQFTTNLNPETNRAFDDYIARTEAQMEWRGRPATTEISVKPSLGKSPIDVADGMIHDWTAQVFIPHTSIEKALRVFQDYPEYKTMFKPEVVESKLIAQDGPHWKTFIKLRRTKVVTAELNSEYDVEYRPLADGRWAIISRSTRIAEVDKNKELHPCQVHGYLWLLNAYWMLEPRLGGIYLECRSISLTRVVHPFIGWIVKPMVSSLPKESLHFTLAAAQDCSPVAVSGAPPPRM